MALYTREQIEQAQNMDLLSYLESRGYQLIYNRHEVRLKEHDSCVISNNKWKWFSQNKGGGTLDFLVAYENRNFKEAMQVLLGERVKAQDMKLKQYIPQPAEKENTKELGQLPERAENYRRIYAYLCKTRGIDSKIVDEMVKNKLLYEDKEYHNCIFIGKNNNDEVKYCLKIGTATDKKFKGELPGSDKRYNLELRNDKNNKIVNVYESIIDAMSHETLIKNRGQDYIKSNKISLGGVSDLKLEQYLKDNPNIEKIVCCLDNDKAGIEASIKIKEKYEKLGYSITKIIPRFGKDFNDELKESIRNKKKTIDEVKSDVSDIKLANTSIDDSRANKNMYKDVAI